MENLFARFESLGANCEFGFVQRRAGIEPAGLLRWAMVSSPAALVAALDSDFAGLFAFDHLAPYNADMVLDRSLGLAFHSALRSVPEAGGFRFADSDADRRDLHRFEAARIAALHAGLRAALASGERMFVFHKHFAPLAPREIAHLFAALRRRGPARLLVVSLADAKHPPGSVIAHVPGLLHGHIDRFAPGERADDVSLDVWTEICRRALEMAPG